MQDGDAELPPGWRVAPLDEIVDAFYSGGTPSTGFPAYWNGSIPWITGADIVDQKVVRPRRWLSVEGARCGGTNVVPSGGLLIVTRTGVGKVAIAPYDVAISQDITGAIPRDGRVTGQFLYWWLATNSKRLEKLRQGTSINGVVREDLAALRIPVPPMDQQRQIASVLSAIDDAIGKTEAVIAATERLRAALLQELLTRGMPGWHTEWKTVPGIGTIPACWEVVRLRQIAEVRAGFALGPERRPKTNPRPYLTVTNVQPDRVALKERRYMEVSPQEYESRHLLAGDIVLVEGHAQLSELGRAAIVPPSAAGFTYQNHLFRVRADPTRSINRFLCAHINGPRGRAYFRSFGGTTSGLNTVSTANVQDLPVPLPSLEEQRLIGRVASAVDARLLTEQGALQHLVSVGSSVADALLSGPGRSNALVRASG